MVTDIRVNPVGYVLVVILVIITLSLFSFSKKLVSKINFEMSGRTQQTERIKLLTIRQTIWIYLFLGVIIFIALLPHLAVILTSITKRWFMTILPEEITFQHYQSLFQHKLTLLSIKNSLLLSSLSTLLDIILGLTIAYLVLRQKIWGSDLLDMLAMLPLALPGLIIAFGYVGSFSGTFLDPRQNPIPLLIISYAIRRLPYLLRSVYAGIQQTSRVLEEASLNLGASVVYTIRKITTPLIMAHLLAGAILAFSFAMLEVSDSLILAMQEKYYPITKAIYILFGRIADGAYIASAMGVLGMILLTISLLIAGKFLGKKMGELFKV